MRRYMVILNPLAGTCGTQVDLEDKIRKGLAPAHVRLIRTTSPEEARAEALLARRGKYDAVITVGGDGTHHWVLDALQGGETPLGLIPLGTANDLAAEHMIPKDVEEACRIIREGGLKDVDLVRTHGKVFATAGGMGLCTDVALGVCEARKRSRLFKAFMRLVGGLIYQLYLVFTVLFSRRLGYTYLVEGEDGKTREVRGYMALVMNQAFLGQNFHAVPGAENDDGLFDVLLIKNIGRRFERLALLATVAKTLKGEHLLLPDIEVVRARRLAIRTPDPVAFFADGELVGRSAAFEFEVLPDALPLCVPLDLAARKAAAPLATRLSRSYSGTGSGSSWGRLAA
jgi:diacylglycerol kinase (ATP)